MSPHKAGSLRRSAFTRHVAINFLLLTVPLVAMSAARATETPAEIQHARKTPATTQPKTAPKAKSGADRSIIFVGGHPQSAGRSEATHSPAHPPGPCAPASRKCSSAGDASSLNPQPIPPGHAAKTMSKEQ